jgi:uncharacterized protein YndB with AHSA1/START domain
MGTTKTTTITIEATVKAPVEKVWKFWTGTEHITKWNTATHEWHSPRASHDLRPGGSFSYRMEAKDGSMGFDFGGVFDVVNPNEYIEYTLGDGRKVKTTFKNIGEETHIIESFDAETENSIELQRNGWQAILNNFKKYVESN